MFYMLIFWGGSDPNIAMNFSRPILILRNEFLSWFQLHDTFEFIIILQKYSIKGTSEVEWCLDYF